MHLIVRGIKQFTVGPAALFVILILFLPGIYTDSISASKAKKIAIICIDDDPSTQRTIRGLKKPLDRSDFEILYKNAILTGEQSADATLMNEISSFDPDLLITIGSFATLMTSRFFPNKPIIFATVMNPAASGFISSMNRPGGNISGAALDVPPDIQFKYFQKVVGRIKTMGVIYSDETENLIRPAQIAAKQLGIELVALRIESEREIPRTLDSLCAVVDAFWTVADQKIFTQQSTQHIILQTLRHRIPLMGFSRALVEAGGLFTLDFDFKDIGRQTGETAVKVLEGKHPSKIPVSTPGAGVIYFKYNEKTAKLISLQIPEELLAIAKEVIK
ncbi:MAG: ABC transporter substrate-binding protein [candidate division Zixibacteria bacterium]